VVRWGRAGCRIVAAVGDVVWSGWVPFAEAIIAAPRLPGVYRAREGSVGEVIYIGMAGERTGGGKPQGIRGRLRVYASGKGWRPGSVKRCSTGRSPIRSGCGPVSTS